MPRAYVKYCIYSRGIPKKRKIMRKSHNTTVVSIVAVFILIVSMWSCRAYNSIQPWEKMRKQI